MNYDVFDRIYNATSPSGAEYDMIAVLKELLKNRAAEMTTDNMQNVTVHIKGDGRKVAVVVPMDRHSFLVRYVGKDGKAFFCTECKEVEEPAGMELQFYNGMKGVIQIDENKKPYMDNTSSQKVIAGDTAQFSGKWSVNPTGGTVEGLELASPIAVYIALTLIEGLKKKSDLYIVFTAQNRVKFFNRGGKILAMNNIKPEIAYWVDCSTKTNSENICVEMGDKQYIADKKETQKIFDAAKATDVCVDRCVGVSDDDIADIALETGVTAIGIYVPMKGEFRNQEVHIKKVRETVRLLEALC